MSKGNPTSLVVATSETETVPQLSETVKSIGIPVLGERITVEM